MIKPKLLKMTLLSLSVGLTACGGGGDDNSSDSEKNGSILFGIASDINTKEPISDAEISFYIRGKQFLTKTNNNGEYSIDFGASLNVAPIYFSGVISKAGYVSQTINLVNNNGSIKASSSSFSLKKSSDIDIPIRSGYTLPYQIFHLGDSNFAGAANSQLQVSSIGMKWSGSLEYDRTKNLLTKYPAV